jgi:acyl carrier protein
MSKLDLFDAARVILAKVLKIEKDEITLQSKLLDDLGIDSVDFWDVIASFDKKYRIRVTEEEAMKLETVADLVEVLEKKFEARVKG